MGGQGFVPEGGQGGLVEGDKEAKKLEEQRPDKPLAGAKERTAGAAPRAGMQGTKERGAAPTTILPRPGTTPGAGRTDVHRTTEQSANTTGTGEGVDTGE
jgi:hypothetical protein